MGEQEQRKGANMITRRHLIAGGVVGAAAAFSSAWRTASASPVATFEVTRGDAEWRKLLTPDQYAVLRHEATERPFTSALLHEERRGTFACAGCDLALFSSTTKFDSRTGWPSFWAPLEKAVGTTTDMSLGMGRTAVHCRRCGGHLGHVFDDGPKPTPSLLRAWAEKYKDQGLIVIGVHAPELAFEKLIDNVRTAVSNLKIGYPVAVDNNYAIWRAFHN
jgi:peptide-methionine (R)-S-oxide reductase